MHPMLNIALRAARSAGDIIIRALDRLDQLTIGAKGPNDFVTNIDRQAEREIIAILHKAYPGHAILAEESGGNSDGEYVWIIDPLDGTMNFMHGLPQFAVSIALQHKGILDQAVIYDPVRQEIFTASRGSGAFLNNRRIRVSQRKSLDGALLGTGFPFRQQQQLDVYLNTFRALFQCVGDIRRPGSAALDLAYVAAGRLDGFWEFGLNSWDMAAGALLIREAGGLVTDMDGNPDFMATGNIVTANARILKAMLRIIRMHLTVTANT